MYATHMLSNASRSSLDKFFEPCVLYLLSLEPSHGYELKANLENKCHCQVDSGNLYRALRKLEADGWVTSTLDRKVQAKLRRVYVITAPGKQYLARWIEELQAQERIIAKLVNNYKQSIKTDRKS